MIIWTLGLTYHNFSLKIWKFDSEALEEAVKLSYTHDTLKSKTVFPTGNSFLKS